MKGLNNVTPLSFFAGNPGDDGPVPIDQSAKSKMVRLLLDRKANTNTSTIKEKRTPLMFAARLGLDKVIGFLLEKKSQVDIQDSNYATALFLAVERGYGPSVRRPLKAGASYNGKDKTGATAAILAAKYGHLDLYHLFMVSITRISTSRIDLVARHSPMLLSLTNWMLYIIS